MLSTGIKSSSLAKNSFVLIQKNAKKINRISSVEKAMKIQTSGVDDNIKGKKDTSLKSEKNKDVKKDEKVNK